jgi:hypothetical protein
MQPIRSAEYCLFLPVIVFLILSNLVCQLHGFNWNVQTNLKVGGNVDINNGILGSNNNIIENSLADKDGAERQSKRRQPEMEEERDSVDELPKPQINTKTRGARRRLLEEEQFEKEESIQW